MSVGLPNTNRRSYNNVVVDPHGSEGGSQHELACRACPRNRRPLSMLGCNRTDCELNGSLKPVFDRGGSKIADEYIVVFKSNVIDVAGKANGLLKNGQGLLQRTYGKALKGFSAHMTAHSSRFSSRGRSFRRICGAGPGNDA